MKKFNFVTLLILFVMSLFIVSCGGGSDSEEPNNTIEEAKEIKLGIENEFTLQPVEDIDWYKFEVPEAGYLRVMVTGKPEDIEVIGRFAKYKEWEGKKEDWICDNRKPPFATVVPEAGTYYLALNEEYNDAESEVKMQFKIEFIEEFDDFEPNNDVENAKKVEFGKNFKLGLFPVDDQDWFKVKVDTAGYISLKTKELPEDIVPLVTYYNYDEWAEPKITELRDREKIPSACFLPKAGEYYFKINEEYDDNSSTDLLEFKLEFLDVLDLNEPNDDFKDAKTVQQGDTVSLSIFPVDDVDYYIVNMSVIDTLAIKASGFENLKPEIKILTKNPDDQNQLNAITDWELLPTQVELEPGKYYISIHDQYDDEANYKNFEVIFE